MPPETPIETGTAIPKLLHIVWVGPHAPPAEMIKSWDDKHVQGWLFTVWKDHRGWKNQDKIDQKYARREYNGVADIIRYEILAKHGGIVVDADSTCLKALDEGPEDFLSNTTAIACYENESVRPGMIGCGFLGAPKNHPFFQACVEDVALQNMALPAWQTVGPLLMGRIATRMPDQIKVYPARMFNPKHFSGTAAPGTAAIYAEQGWGSTKGYNALRKWPCQCPECTITAIRPPWG